MKKQTILYFIACMLCVVSLAICALPVQADAQADEPNLTSLEKAYAREKIAMDNQKERIATARSSISKTLELIDKLKDAGVDTAALESALAVFKSAVDETQNEHDQSVSIIAAGVGFDPGGKVTNKQQAWDTVREAGNHLRRAHLKISQAAMDFHQALNDYLESLKK
jgi:hypothetical protein